MKRLHLIRHAKSSWSDGSLADIARPLNKRGFRSCEVMAPEIVKAGCCFTHVFCSPAVRAQTTIEEIAAHLSIQQPEQLENCDITWQVDNALYTFVEKDLLKWCQSLDESLFDVVVIGHNSALTDFVNIAAGQHIENVPTCGYVQLALEGAWSSVSLGSAALVSFLKPKMFMS